MNCIICGKWLDGWDDDDCCGHDQIHSGITCEDCCQKELSEEMRLHSNEIPY